MELNAFEVEVSIIILNYNTYGFVRRCLLSIQEYLDLGLVEVIVADNNSPNREIENVVIEYPWVRYLPLETNSGFGGGCNCAARSANGQVLLFLNPDTELVDDSIMRLKRHLDSGRAEGVMSGLLTDKEGNLMYCFDSFHDPALELQHAIGFGYEKRILRLLSSTSVESGQMFETDWFHGAFLMMRREDFQRVGGFDERYFMYFEDQQLCYDFKRNLKLKVVCMPDVRIRHSTQSSLEGEKLDNIKNFHMHRGKLLFIDSLGFTTRILIRALGVFNVLLRLVLLPFWRKHSMHRSEKALQLRKILRLYFNRAYLNSSKYEYIKI